MARSDYLFIHPWLHRDESWAGFQLTHGGEAASYGEALAILARHPAVATLDHRLQWFIPLLSPLTVAHGEPLRNKVLLVSARTAAETENLEGELRRSGCQLGLILEPDTPLPPTGAWSHVILGAGQARTLPPFSLVGLATRTTIAITGLRSRSDLNWALANNCSLITGEYLLNRSAPCNKPDMMRVRLLKLLALIANDADSREIEEIFRQEPKLAYGLLRLVNSAAMGPRNPITSFAQAIAILGRQQLQRWLQLLVYADPNDGQHPNPLLLQAATRGRLMEILAREMEPPPAEETTADELFMLGTFSLLDVLLNLSIQEILGQLPLPKLIHAALADHAGPYGQLLLALAAADNRDLEEAAKLLAGLGIAPEAFITAQLTALEWASRIRPTA